MSSKKKNKTETFNRFVTLDLSLDPGDGIDDKSDQRLKRWKGGEQGTSKKEKANLKMANVKRGKEKGRRKNKK